MSLLSYSLIFWMIPFLNWLPPSDEPIVCRCLTWLSGLSCLLYYPINAAMSWWSTLSPFLLERGLEGIKGSSKTLSTSLLSVSDSFTLSCWREDCTLWNSLNETGLECCSRKLAETPWGSSTDSASSLMLKRLSSQLSWSCWRRLAESLIGESTNEVMLDSILLKPGPFSSRPCDFSIRRGSSSLIALISLPRARRL